MRENTERRESKSPGRALWGWINTTPPRIREGATIHQPPAVVCLSASCTLTTTSILNQTPLLFSFYSRFWQPPASFHGVGACTNPFFGGVGNWGCDELNYTRSKFDISLFFALRQLDCSVTRRFDHFSCPPILATGEIRTNSIFWIFLWISFRFFCFLGKLEKRKIWKEETFEKIFFLKIFVWGLNVEFFYGLVLVLSSL